MKVFLLFLLTTLFGLSANAADATMPSMSTSANTTTYSPEVCQFSLTSYSGTITNGCTGNFKVGLSCPQEKDVRATVVVFIDDEHAASQVVTINAGTDYSNSVSIHVGSSYNGKRYKLIVQ